jgi:hypothetical protein
MRTLADPAVAAGLAARLERLTATQPRVWGSMTPHQMLAHVADAADAAMARQPFPPARRATSRLMKFVALYLPVRWPHGVQAGAQPAALVLPPETFATERTRAIAALAALAAPGTHLAPQHPLFGPMSRRDWQRWAFLHTDHHLRQFGL